MKDKRKTRLNKTQGTKTEFVGFGAFASGDDTTGSKSLQQARPRWSPVYTGRDSHLATLVFPRLIKRDATTKVKALEELQEYFQRDDLPKKQQVDALAHLLFLYYSKLTYDSSSSVRAEAVVALSLAAQRLPKAFSTLVQQNNRQVLGMMYICHGDPAAEVRSAASKNISVSDPSNETEAYSLIDMEAGLWSYVERILCYGRASKMQEDLFATSRKNSSAGGNTASKSSADDLNESQKDQLEERFERIVGTALSGMQVWIQRQGIINDENPLIITSKTFLWKTLSSPRSSLRNRTYSLLATCAQKAPRVIFDNHQAFSQTLPQAIASEKEAGNIACLLEATLSFLAGYSRYHSTVSTWDSCFNAGTVSKHLVKVFKKSCYGASATQWGPILLPLLAMLPSLSEQVAVLSAVWTGREQTIRMGDQWVVSRTVSESASFFLLRKHNASQLAAANDVEYAKELAKLWVDCLQNFIGTETSNTGKSSKGGPFNQAQIALGKGLAKELRQFDEDRPGCLMHTIRDWFWKELTSKCIVEAEGNQALATILQHINGLQSSQISAKKLSPTPSSYLIAVLGEKFRKLLAAFQDRSGSVPSVDGYQVMIAILQHCGVQVLDKNGNDGGTAMTTEKFLMNDVLRWMVIHTSALSTQKQTTALAQKDFILFGVCSAGLPSAEARSKLWETLLREVFAAKCRLDLLLAGMQALLEQDKTWKEIIQCDLLDEFAVHVVRDATDKPVRGTTTDECGSKANEQEIALKEFLQACAGLHPYVPSLVRRPVLSTWVDITCNTDGGHCAVPSPIIATLIALCFGPSALSEREIHCIVLQCWRQGGHVWNGDGMRLLIKESTGSDLMSALFEQAGTALKSKLVEWSSKADDRNADAAARIWSDRAWRLVRLSREAASCDVKTPCPSLNLVGLADMALWEPNSGCCQFLFSCLMRLLGKTTDPTERLQLLQESDDNNSANFTIHIFTSLSEASTDGIDAAKTAQQKDRCAQLLSALGGSSQLGRRLVEQWLKAAVTHIAELIEEGNMRKTRKGVAVISQICCLLIDEIKPVDVLSAPDNDDDDDLSDEFGREKLAKLIVPLLENGTLSALPWDSCIAELVNVIVFHIGVGTSRGIGSLHYDVFQLILAAEGRLLTHLSNLEEDRGEMIEQEVWLLALSCGFGYNASFHKWDPQLLPYDPDKITVSLLDYLENQANRDQASTVGRAVLSWLITASATLKDTDLQSRAVRVMYKECISILSAKAKLNASFDGNVLMALRGINTAQLNGGDMESMGTQAMMCVVGAFLGSWEDSKTECGIVGQAFDATCRPIATNQPEWQSLPYFNDIISFALSRSAQSVVASTSDFTDDLVEALFIPSKRWYAYRLLDVIANSAQELGDPSPEEETARRLGEWVEGLDDEEKSELVEDIEICSEILPHKLMTEIESWSEEEYASTMEEDVIMGRMLVWLCALNYVDVFVRKDPTNRPSLCTYLLKSGAADSILNLTLLHTGVGTDKSRASSDVDELLVQDSVLDEVPLASMVLFRTVEALPTMARRWWDEECPKSFKDTIRDYIEEQIAPKILEKELERLKYSTIQNAAMGALTVTGSVSTGEITATYTQDEIKLKVLISLPTFYPLRNANVDCSQTLGIPAQRCRLWELQIAIMLNNQGGTLQEALMLWKDNVDEEFKGVEPCPVCYSVLHVKTHKLPELECTTCSNRFHVQCLHQWFRSSGKNQCVLCQQQWVGTRVKK